MRLPQFENRPCLFSQFAFLLALVLANTTTFSQTTPPNNLAEKNQNHKEHIGGCATPPPTPKEIEKTIEEVATIRVPENFGTNCIAIKPHIFRLDDGTGGLTTEQLAIGLSFLNAQYYAAGLEFYYCGTANYINNSDLYEFDGTAPDNDSEDDLVAATTIAPDAVNVFFVNSVVTSSGFNACGYARFPNDSPVANRIVMDNGCTWVYDNGTYPHEFGHYFNLYHTHQSTESGPTSTFAEHVPRTGPQSNCLTDGDLLCDTEADPRYDSDDFTTSSCTYTGSGTDQFGNPYTPPVDNVMSYYPDVCGGMFTPDQYARIQQGYLTRLGHTSYSFDCPPPIVAVPTGLTAALVNSQINLTWTDAANNELGYLIERSSISATEGFQVVVGGGVGENGTAFSDFTISANNTYWYRVKPINGDCNTYSSTASVTVGLIYCSANAGTCDEYISRVQIGTIDNSTACTAGGYMDYSAQSTEVEIGVGQTLTVTNGNTSYPTDECGAWVDWNHDGDFEDANETIIVSGSPGVGPYTATITPPVGAAPGAAVLRIRITWRKTPAPCGTDTYGEVEDYTLNLNTCPSPTMRVWTGAVNSQWNEAGNWDCGIPTITEDVTIPNGTPAVILADGQTGNCLTLTVEDGAILTVEDGAVLNVMEE